MKVFNKKTYPKLHPTENDDLDEEQEDAVHIAELPGDRDEEVDLLVPFQIVEMLLQVFVARRDGLVGELANRFPAAGLDQRLEVILDLLVRVRFVLVVRQQLRVVGRFRLVQKQIRVQAHCGAIQFQRSGLREQQTTVARIHQQVRRVVGCVQIVQVFFDLLDLLVAQRTLLFGAQQVVVLLLLVRLVALLLFALLLLFLVEFTVLVDDYADLRIRLVVL